MFQRVFSNANSVAQVKTLGQDITDVLITIGLNKSNHIGWKNRPEFLYQDQFIAACSASGSGSLILKNFQEKAALSRRE